ncbi:hypothetical protein ACFV9C_31225 [Kribbella sp. NPDC059898]|uniref:hypothetical protein n=1 Tax=Kribbella sp. NPDC059898 TaxID=3346995 RepID=UPI0036517B0A
MTDYVAQDRMRRLIDSGAAKPMMDGMEVGPAFYDERWWYVPDDAADDADFESADAALSERFAGLRRRAEAIERVQAELDGRA